ncbi:hypothetical protein [Sulfitobacter dubius]|uniref:hypothetical protein n=1 Tax=Sulfitobacter dubius TaxID=218673 RepID=UPI0022AF3BF0|nr:hypothetical protein [Sulfitobacter dubius]MCZ4366641.1 hypothetical protein [Sulfitobacter dubius]
MNQSQIDILLEQRPVLERMKSEHERGSHEHYALHSAISLIDRVVRDAESRD